MLDFLGIYGKENRPIDSAITDCFIGKPVTVCSFKYKDSLYLFSEKKDRFFMACSSDTRSHIAFIKNGAEKEIAFFDGCISQQNFTTDIRTLSPILEGGAIEQADVFGRYCYGVFSFTGRNHIHRDILGMYPLFVGINDACTVFSNNPYLAAEALYGADWKNKKDIYSLANLVMAGEIAGGKTSFLNVYSVPQNTCIVIGGGNAAVCGALVNKMYYHKKDDEWEACFEKTYTQLLHFVKTYAEEGGVGDITGGFDSRVLLALCIAAGVHKKIEYEVLGYEEHSDVIAAQAIARHLNIPIKRKSFTAASGADIESTFKEALKMYSENAGMISFVDTWADAFGLLSRRKPKNRRYFAGLAGEMFRSYFSFPHYCKNGIGNKIITEEDYKSIFEKRVSSFFMLSESNSSYYFNIYKNLFQSFEDLYSCDLIHFRLRGPQFHGGMHFKNDAVCALGYNFNLHRLAMIEAPEKRVSQNLPFRLIERAAPDLLFLPFADNAWPALSYAHRQDSGRFFAVKPIINANKKPLPSQSNLVEQVRFLLNLNSPLDNAVYRVFNEEFVSCLLHNARSMTGGGKGYAASLWCLINIYGLNLFITNKEEFVCAGGGGAVLCFRGSLWNRGPRGG
ncbi:MAG: hypothetical protein LBD20_06770, partial [Spirochaetaceae bacterium]|nr:hypothetical protein [Spirochaetaceae bacterium]